MGQKVNPVVFRIGHTRQWKSRWFSKNKYQSYLKQDVLLRDFILKKFSKSGIEEVDIERSADSVSLIIKTARPGLIIGRGGGGVEDLKKQATQLILKQDKGKKAPLIKIEIEEVSEPESHAQIMADWMSDQIEKRIPYRRALKQGLDKIIQSKSVQGAKIMVRGRLDGAEIARTGWLSKGKIPLQTLRADIQFALSTAFTTYGTVGVKVWIYKGEKFD